MIEFINGLTAIIVIIVIVLWGISVLGFLSDIHERLKEIRHHLANIAALLEKEE